MAPMNSFAKALLSALCLTVCSIAAHLKSSEEISNVDTCVAISDNINSVEDVRAKRRDHNNVCANDRYHHLLKRQAESTLDDYSCGPSKPCSNGACCATTGYCGYGPDSCGDGTTPNEKCYSNCDAHAECGRYAATPGATCPLNVCCSQFGFCGTTSDFCTETDDPDTTCQSNCAQPGSGSSGSNVQSRIIGYYEIWNWEKNCIGMSLSDIPVGSITHLYYSFGYIDPQTYDITTMDGTIPTNLFSQITDLKKINPSLKVVISLGGWTFSDNGTAQQPVFPSIAGSTSVQATFITNLMNFLQNYGFDGVDFDWEYPGAGDRGGSPADGPGYTQMLRSLRAAYDGIISFTAPTSYWYLRHFDLKNMVDTVDFVNVLSYDLHGTWDSSDPIGNHVLAHTNLTEIQLALDLYWRNQIPANKINLGLGFYGRSFQLTDPSCYEPGCLFKGGASPGPCTDNSGTLSYREIQDIINQYNLVPFYDVGNQVKYITWGGDQWVSFDDQDTFQAKIAYANDVGLGGLLIWSLDQDTAQLDALAGVLYPNTLGSLQDANGANNWQDIGSESCRVTSCGVTGCAPGEVRMTDQQCDGSGRRSSLCCPIGSAPDPSQCTWRGNPLLCNGICHPGEVSMEQNPWGDGGHCNDGNKIYCCQATAELPQCRWSGCGESCSSDENTLTWSDDYCFLKRRNFCCAKDQDWQNCHWQGKSGSCFDNSCPVNQVALTTAYDGEGVTCGINLFRQRSFCCDPPAGHNLFSPVPLSYLFENPPEGDDVDVDYTLKVDPTFGGSVGGGSGPGGANIGIALPDDPTDAEFGFVILASPEELQVTLDKRDGSHWDVFDCFDAKTEGEHTVRMVCTDDSEESNCGKIHLGHGAPGTIVEMPRGCGPGKYAVVKSMEESSNQQLPTHLRKRELPLSKVYDLTFDYDFSRVPRDLGDTQMRIDFSNEPGYWDTIVDHSANKRKVKRDLSGHGGSHKRWLEDAYRQDKNSVSHDDLHKRWFAEDVITWLKELLIGDDDIDIPIVGNNYNQDFTVVLLDETFPDCPVGGGVTVNGRLNVQATTSVDITTNFGFTLVTTLGSFSLANSYLYFRNRGDVDAVFSANAVAQATWTSGDVKLFSADQFGATFSVPGIVTIGPNFQLNARVEGSVTLAANFQASVKVAQWDVRQTFPVANNDWSPQSKDTPSRDGTQEVGVPQFQYGVSANGVLTAHVRPIVSFGLQFNDKLPVVSGLSATVNLIADGHVTFHADASAGSSGSKFCYGIDAGADLLASVDAPQFPGWSLGGQEYPIASTPAIQIVPYQCPVMSRDLGLDAGDGFGMTNYSIDHARLLMSPDAPSSLHNSPSLSKRAQVYGPVFHIPTVSCPGAKDSGTLTNCALCGTDEGADGGNAGSRRKRQSGESCVVVQGNPDEDTCPSGISARDLESFDFGNETVDYTLSVESFINDLDLPEIDKRGSKTNQWDGQTVSFGTYPSCGQAAQLPEVSKWWAFDQRNQDPAACPLAVRQLTTAQITRSGDYQTEHVFESQTILIFFDMLRGNRFPLPPGYTAASTSWITGRLIGLNVAGYPAFAFQDGGQRPSLRVAMSFGLGGSRGGLDRLTLFQKQANNYKGAWLSLKTPAVALGASLRDTKIRHRDAAGAFSYLRQQQIWTKYQDSSLMIENTLKNFDAAYPWGSSPGELGRPNRANAGLRDLWCWFMDIYLNQVEQNAQAWTTSARVKLSNSQQSGQPGGQAWIAGFFGPTGAGAGTNVQFLHPGTQALPPGTLGRSLTESRYGVWDGSEDPAGPY